VRNLLVNVIALLITILYLNLTHWSIEKSEKRNNKKEQNTQTPKHPIIKQSADRKLQTEQLQFSWQRFAEFYM